MCKSGKQFLFSVTKFTMVLKIEIFIYFFSLQGLFKTRCTILFLYFIELGTNYKMLGFLKF